MGIGFGRRSIIHALMFWGVWGVWGVVSVLGLSFAVEFGFCVWVVAFGTGVIWI